MAVGAEKGGGKSGACAGVFAAHVPFPVQLEYGDFADVTTKALYDAVHPPLVEDSAEADRLIKPKHPPHMGVKVMF